MRLFSQATENSLCAYVAVLYGNNEYFLGALMLGFSLSKTKSRYDKVILVTPDVPDEQIAVLSKYFKVKKIPYIRIPDDSFSEKNTIFREVFTKLNVFNLIEYKKVLLMDLDMLVLKNMDHLFEMSTPSAKFRKSGLTMGQLSPPDFITLVRDKSGTFDEVSGGINAGLMLLEPNIKEFEDMMKELEQPLPYKVCEPEQDYLSYRYRDKWRHIDCKYNYQFTIPVVVRDYPYEIHEIYNLHYSWYINPWELLFGNREKCIFIIEHLGAEKYVPNTAFFEMWESEFLILNQALKSEGIDALALVKVTGMRDDVIDEYYQQCRSPVSGMHL